MATRIELQSKLEDILGSRNVYFQPPENTRMNYPAIRYNLNAINNKHANNTVYKQDNSYTLILICDDPDSDLIHKLSTLPLCRFVRQYVSDNLYHTVYTLYF